MKVSSHDYLKLLESWLKPAARFIFTPADRPDLKCFGPGDTNWGVQTNQKALAAYAVCAADPAFDPSRAGMSADEARDLALAMLRYSLESHIAGGSTCLSGGQWGHHWISPLGIERMMHGVHALEPHLTGRDRELLRAVLISESMWFLDKYPVVAGLCSKDHNNKPESNLWNGAVMVRTAYMYPDIPRRDEILEKGCTLLINAISVPADAEDATVKDGRPVKDRFIGPQFFDTYALNHHGYLNTGYMVICLSNAAMLYFACREKGWDVPASLLHHVDGLWGLVKKLTLPDGRLLRIGGDTRVRYCYCQDYCIPAWLMMVDRYDDRDCVAFERGWADLLHLETKNNGDGLFLSDRCSGLAAVSPLYYARLEADRAGTISMGAWWRRIFTFTETDTPPAAVSAEWHDTYHGAVYVRSPERVASWVWDAGEKPQGLFGPPLRSDIFEWRENLACEIKGEGNVNTQEISAHTDQPFSGGFLTCGRTTVRSEGMIAEGQADNPEAAFQQLVFAALPDGATVILLQYATAGPVLTALTAVKGLHLMIPNDIFNNGQRMYYTGKRIHEIAGLSGRQSIIDLQSTVVNIDDALTVGQVYGSTGLQLLRPGERQVGLKTYPGPRTWRAGGMLYCDELCAPCLLGHRFVQGGEVLVDAGFVMRIGTHREMETVGTESAVLKAQAAVRGLTVTGTDRRVYLLAYNITSAHTAFQTEQDDLIEPASGRALEGKKIELGPYQARLFVTV